MASLTQKILFPLKYLSLWVLLGTVLLLRTLYALCRKVAPLPEKPLLAIDLLLPVLKRRHGVASTFRRCYRIYEKDGSFAAAAFLSKGRFSEAPILPLFERTAYSQQFQRPSYSLLGERIVIIGEMSLPQCKKYRIDQKQEMLSDQGKDCRTVDFRDFETALTELQLASLVIFYRVPAFPDVLRLMKEAKRLNIPTFFDIDDLIFHEDVLQASKTIQQLDSDTRKGVLNGANLYKDAMLNCDYGIVSTTGLRQAMEKAGLSQVFVVENALDRETLKLAESLSPKGATDEKIRIVYGSGTNTHGVDFLEAADALLEVLRSNRNVVFRLIGKLRLPDSFSAVEDQIERIPFCTFEEYVNHLSACDISIAPLENFVFNDAKSNIKYLEASILSIPSVCSRRSAFCSVIRNGENGFLCDTTEEWETALRTLVNDRNLRQKIAASANADVLSLYAPQNIATTQLLPALEQVKKPFTKNPRVLSVNVYYEPESFGGATIVAEEMNKRLARTNEYDLYALTVLREGISEPYTVRRYSASGVPVFGVSLPTIRSAEQSYYNENLASCFQEILCEIRPDLVHLHSIQNIGIALPKLCQTLGIPYIITVHDAWWLCGRQFMFKEDGTPCLQQTIDMTDCEKCLNNSHFANTRFRELTDTLAKAERILFPSVFFQKFYQRNGVPPGKTLVNTNGIKKPQKRTRIWHGNAPRFGYVGGNVDVKGIRIIEKIFSKKAFSPFPLKLVNNTSPLGLNSYEYSSLNCCENVEIVPAYTQETMDGFFDSIDVLLFPSQWTESFGLTVREAIARNVWVISTNAGGVTEAIVPGKNGIITELTDGSKAFEQAVTDTISHYEHYETGQEIELPKDIVWFEDQAEELQEIYNQILCI